MPRNSSPAVGAPITWFGAKSRLAEFIVGHFPRHVTFVDVFGGAGAVLLANSRRKVEVYNDINAKLAVLFRVLSDKDAAAELQRRLDWTLYSRAEFEFCRSGLNGVTGVTCDLGPIGATGVIDDIEIARRFFVTQRQSHGGLGASWSYSVEESSAGHSNSVRKFRLGIERLPNIAHRLRQVQVENLPWQDILRRYDRATTLFYLDPPYVLGTRVAGQYEFEMDIADHEALVGALLKIDGRAVLSGYSHPVYTPLEVAGWRRVDVGVVSHASRSRQTRTESLWLSPNCAELESGAGTTCYETVEGLPDVLYGVRGRVAVVKRLHAKRVAQSEQAITQAIQLIERNGRRVTKAEVSRLCGLSTTQLHKRYAHLFESAA